MVRQNVPSELRGEERMSTENNAGLKKYHIPENLTKLTLRR